MLVSVQEELICYSFEGDLEFPIELTAEDVQPRIGGGVHDTEGMAISLSMNCSSRRSWRMWEGIDREGS